MREAAARGLWLVQNPRSNEGNKVGYPPDLRWSPKVALGTDGWASDMPTEAKALVRLATDNGDTDPQLKRRLDRGHQLVAERFDATQEAFSEGALGDFVTTEAGRVRDVIIDGEVVVRDGQLERGDLESINAEARESAARLWERMKQL